MATIKPLLEKLKVVTTEPEYKEIIIQIISLLNSGDLKPGQVLPGERILAEHFQVGRASVRAALKFLEFIGVIRINVGKGAYISNDARNLAFIHMIDLLEIFKNNPFKDLIEARKVIETKMAALAALNAEEEDLTEMEEALSEMEQDIYKKGKGVSGTDRFHMTIYKASKNVILYKIGLMLQGLMHESREISLAIPGRAERSLQEHHQIFEAIKERDGIKAGELMDEHLSRVAKERRLN
jgi:GntR family transcriptional regulator, transcriptional repressor for pyruvate dehydrogenase complex